jgi:hypothetical protein
MSSFHWFQWLTLGAAILNVLIHFYGASVTKNPSTAVTQMASILGVVFFQWVLWFGGWYSL